MKQNSNLYLCRNILAASANFIFVRKYSFPDTKEALFSISCISELTRVATYCSCCGFSGSGSISHLTKTKSLIKTCSMHILLEHTKISLQCTKPSSAALLSENGHRKLRVFVVNFLVAIVGLLTTTTC